MANRRTIIKIGERFGRWTVVSEAQQRGIHRFAICRCECGAERAVKLVNLRHGGSLSCGCLSRELAGNPTRHGNSRNGHQTAEYRAWQAMIQRCTNPKNDNFEYYGGRGIKVCDRWRNSYADFLGDMGRRPSRRHSIDRKDNDGNYEKGNCRWATRFLQNTNRRRSFQHYSALAPEN